MKLRNLFAALCLCLLLASPAAAAGGSGTEADPYIIQTAAELQSIQNNLAAYYQLANDIDLSGVTWTPIGSLSAGFYGSFDGNGKTIKNLDLSTSTQRSGLFSVVTSGAVIKDVTFQDCSVTSTSSWCGVVIGSIYMSSSAHETAVISNVDLIRCSVSSTANSVGCLIGRAIEYANVEITDCNVSYCFAESTNGDNVGCLIGDFVNNSLIKITRCNVMYSHCRVNNSQAAGGFIGLCSKSSVSIDSSTIQNSIIESTNSDIVGCLIGNCQSTTSVNTLNCDVVNCLAKGNNFVGGIIGLCDVSNPIITAQNCDITDCSIIATTNYAGGIAGGCVSGTTGTFTDCTVTDSTILALSYAAGICPAYNIVKEES